METSWKDEVIKECGKILAKILATGNIEKYKALKTRARRGVSDYMIYGYEGFFLFLLHKSNIHNVLENIIQLKQNKLPNISSEGYELYFAIILYLLSYITDKNYDDLLKLDDNTLSNDSEFIKSIINQLFESKKKKKISQHYIEDILVILKHMFSVIS